MTAITLPLPTGAFRSGMSSRTDLRGAADAHVPTAVETFNVCYWQAIGTDDTVSLLTARLSTMRDLLSLKNASTAALTGKDKGEIALK